MKWLICHLSVQERLLDYLQSGMISIMEETYPIHLSVRIITASSKNLEKAMHEGTFNEELYYVLNRIVYPNSSSTISKRRYTIDCRTSTCETESGIRNEYRKITDEALERLQAI